MLASVRLVQFHYAHAAFNLILHYFSFSYLPPSSRLPSSSSCPARSCKSTLAWSLSPPALSSHLQQNSIGIKFSPSSVTAAISPPPLLYRLGLWEETVAMAAVQSHSGPSVLKRAWWSSSAHKDYPLRLPPPPALLLQTSVNRISMLIRSKKNPYFNHRLPLVSSHPLIPSGHVVLASRNQPSLNVAVPLVHLLNHPLVPAPGKSEWTLVSILQEMSPPSVMT